VESIAACRECGCPVAVHDEQGCTRRLAGSGLLPPRRCDCRCGALAARLSDRQPQTTGARFGGGEAGGVVKFRSRRTKAGDEDRAEIVRRRFGEAAREGRPLRLHPKVGTPFDVAALEGEQYYLLSAPAAPRPFVASEYDSVEHLPRLGGVRLVDDAGHELQQAPRDLFGCRLEFEVRGVPRADIYRVEVLVDTHVRSLKAPDRIRAGAHVTPITSFSVYLIGKVWRSLHLSIHRVTRHFVPGDSDDFLPEWEREFRFS